MEYIDVKELKSNYRFFIVPSEKLNSLRLKDVKYLRSDERTYQVTDVFNVHKGDVFPKVFLKAITGEEIDESKIWEYYKKSDVIHIFVAKPKNNN